MSPAKILRGFHQGDKYSVFAAAAAAGGGRGGSVCVEEGGHAWSGDSHELEDVGEDEVEGEQEGEGWEGVAN